MTAETARATDARAVEAEREGDWPHAPSPRTKSCPRCGSVLFEDQDVCFGCLYDFSHVPSSHALPDPDATLARNQAEGALAPAPARCPPTAERPRLVIDAGVVRVVCPIPEQGLSVGRAQDNDVVVASRMVSRHQVRVFASNGCDEATVEDQGSTNPSLVDGEELSGRSVLRPGSVLEVGDVSCTLEGSVG